MIIQEDFSGHSLIEITDHELDELQDFLLSDAVPERVMLLDTLGGFFTALVIGPGTVLPSTWLPFVWDMSGRKEEPKFETLEQAQRIVELLMKMMNSFVMKLSTYPDYYEPRPGTMALESDETRDFLIKQWATGFMIGVNGSGTAWDPLLLDKQFLMLLTPIYLLSLRADDTLPLEPEMCRVWERVPECLRGINEFWLPYRRGEMATGKGMALAIEAERIGRNDPCLCGSGKKFKKCCGK